MVSLKYCVSFYLFVFLSGFLSSEIEADPTYSDYFCGNETYNSTAKLHNNLNVLLASLTSNATLDGGYYTTAMGFGSTDAVNGLFLCRGDVSTTVCLDCVSTAAKEIIRRCPNQTEAVIWYVECMLRYTNRYFASQSLIPGETLKNGTEISSTNSEQFNQSLFSLLNDLLTSASESERSFAAGAVSLSSSQTVYGLEQCTRDINDAQCKTCLDNAIGLLPTCCGGQQGATVLLASCNIRYELYPFYNLTAVSLVPPSSGKKKSGSRTIVIIVVPVAASVFLFFVGYYMLRRRSRRNFRTILRENFGNEGTTLESLQFSLATIEASTNKFSNDNRIGHGGFGEVYKGILPDGREIAVKRLSKTSGQGAVEFKNEILLIAKLQHRNLVALLGFCLDEQEKMLIYEYVPNKSLDHFLFDSNKWRLLNWFERYKIIEGIARGILYLHEYSRLKVIHRDLKPSNVLLDDKMNPKISDFGMARIIAIDQGQESTNRIVGTYGYMSPEYAMHGQFSEKSDVFSFGVMVLEIISGRKNARNFLSHSVDDLLSDSWRHWRAKTPLELLDPALQESYNEDEVIKCIQIGLLCVEENPNDRPAMAKVVLYLSSLALTELPLPREAVFVHNDMMRPNMVAAEYSSDQSTNDVSMSTFYPR